MRIPIQKALERQTDMLLSNIQVLVDLYPQFEAEAGDWDYGAQLFHLVTSLDKWFVDPDGERGNVVEMLRRAHHRIPAADMTSYFKDIAERIREFIHSNPDWESSPGEMEWSHLELVMGQFRHAMHHVGYLHACLRFKGIKPPEWIGLSQSGKHARSA